MNKQISKYLNSGKFKKKMESIISYIKLFYEII